MARPPDVERRRALLDALIEAFADGGIGDRSLREIAEAVGTSHRMLLHHFGSRDELLLAIVDEVERRQMASCPTRPPSPPTRWRRCGPTSAGPSCARSSGCSSSATPAARRASSRSRGCCRVPSSRGSARSTRRRTTVPIPRSCGSVWLSSAGCCSTWSPPATTTASMPLHRRSWICCASAQTSAASLPASRST